MDYLREQSIVLAININTPVEYFWTMPYGELQEFIRSYNKVVSERGQ